MQRRVLVVVLAVSVIACTSARQPPEGGGGQDQLATCTGCHGDPANGNAAPPRSVSGATATTDVRVGAHQQHLRDSGIRTALDCSECHVVPVNISDPGHIDNNVADLAWGPVANSGNVAPSPPNGPAPATDTLTCTNYCHGGAFAANNGSNHRPSWTVVDGSQAGCGTCHGIPPPPPHPPVAAVATVCVNCHPATINGAGVIDVAGGKHINGVVDVSDSICTGCHGDANRQPGSIAAAPPRDVSGNTATSAPGVGAHQAHLLGGALSAPIACSQCHVVPSDAAHASAPITLTWGALPTTGGVVPSPASGPVPGNNNVTCTNYCHGASLTGGTLTSPNWTQGPAAVATCTSCHGVPPPSGDHAGSHTPFLCGACHGLGYTSTTVVAAQHVNGVKNVGGSSSAVTSYDPATRSCTPQCHGTRTWPTP